MRSLYRSRALKTAAKKLARYKLELVDVQQLDGTGEWGHYKSADYIQGVSRLSGITAGRDFLGFCDQKSSYKHVPDFGRLRSYGRFLIPVHALV